MNSSIEQKKFFVLENEDSKLPFFVIEFENLSLYKAVTETLISFTLFKINFV
jgi:hypothetical protein